MARSGSRNTTRSSRSEEHTSELQSHDNLVCRLLLEKKKTTQHTTYIIIKTIRRRPTTSSQSVDNAVLYSLCHFFVFFFFNDTATTEIYTLSLHDALPISTTRSSRCRAACWRRGNRGRRSSIP